MATNKVGLIRLFPISFTIQWIGIDLFRYELYWNFKNVWDYIIVLEIICLKFSLSLNRISYRKLINIFITKKK